MILTNTNSPVTRGAFVVFEGVDRCGKTTQTALLVKRLVAAGLAATLLRFPDRATATGGLIDSYLASGTNLDDRAVHLLFSANRWEAAKDLTRQLAQGTTVICDRYAYSGVAFSASKVDANDKQILSMEWCQAPDKGLPAPDCVIFLDLSQEEAEKRGGYGGERYEKKDMQMRVRQRFSELQKMDEQTQAVPWKMIDAGQSVEDVEADIWKAVQETLQQVQQGKDLGKMWQEGNYEFQSLEEKEN